MVSGLLGLLVVILIVGVVIALLFWLIDYIPLPAPFNRLAKAVTAVIGVIIIIVYALPLAGVAVK